MSRNSKKVTVWSALSVNEVTYIYYFDNSTMDGESFLHLLPEHFLPILSTLPEKTILQQDGALTHYSSRVRQLLDNSLTGSWNGRDVPISRPPLSPDLTPLDFFTWGFAKNRTYHTPFPNLTQVNRRITSVIRRNNTETFQNEWKIAQDRSNAIVRKNGGHIEHLQGYEKTFTVAYITLKEFSQFLWLFSFLLGFHSCHVLWDTVYFTK